MKKRVVIFDLFGVLFFLNTRKVLRQVGIADNFCYYLKHHKTPFDALLQLLNVMRRQLPNEFQDSVAYKGTLLPQSLCLWQKGLLEGREVFDKVCAFVDEWYQHGNGKSTKEHKLFVNVLRILIDPACRILLLDPNKQLISILEGLRKKGYRLFLLSNIDCELLEILEHTYPRFLLCLKQLRCLTSPRCSNQKEQCLNIS